MNAGGFLNPPRARRVQAPLEMIAFDDDGAGDVPVGAALKLRADIDEQRAVFDRAQGLAWTKASQPRPRPDEKPIQSIASASPSAMHRYFVTATPSTCTSSRWLTRMP